MIIKARKKPVTVDAIEFTGWNWADCQQFMSDEPLFFTQEVRYQEEMYIDTLEGKMRADVGDYIIRGVSNEYYPCKPDIFDKTYDIVDNKSELIEEVISFIDNNTAHYFKIHVDVDDSDGHIGIGISHDSLSSEEVFSEARGLNRLAVKEGIKVTIYANA